MKKGKMRQQCRSMICKKFVCVLRDSKPQGESFVDVTKQKGC